MRVLLLHLCHKKVPEFELELKYLSGSEYLLMCLLVYLLVLNLALFVLESEKEFVCLLVLS